LCSTDQRSQRVTADWLYEQAPFGLLVQDGSDDPRFVYANRTAQKCFEYTWSQVVGLPSSSPPTRDGRGQSRRLTASRRARPL